MDISLLLKTIGIGLIVAVAGVLLQKAGKDELATLVTVAGITVIIIMLIGQFETLLTTVRQLFNL